MPDSSSHSALNALPFIRQTRTLLLVEDSRVAAEAVRLICRCLGLRLRRAETLESARLHLRVYRPDIALIDLGLPDGSGLDLIDRLNRLTPRISRIVAISGDPVLGAAAHRAGADAFLEKPISLATHLEQMLGRRAETPAGLGPAAIARGTTGHAGPRPSRNTGADPLALRDDLMRATRLLSEAGQNPNGAPALTGYAAQFLAGIARSLEDWPLMELAERTRLNGHPEALLAHLHHRMESQPLL